MAIANKARRIAVISGKGGVGKTVITANLAAALGASGRRVLVLDADLGLANLDIILGLDPKHTIQDVFHGKCRIEDALIQTSKGFDFLPAGSGLQESTVLSKFLAERVENLLAELENRYDIILFDVGAGVGDIVLFFANLADRILVVVTPEPTSMMDAYASIKVLNRQYERNEFLLVVNLAHPEHPDRTGNSVTSHLQSVISKFVDPDRSPKVSLQLLGSLPQDPAIPRSIKNRQLLSETVPLAVSVGYVNTLADSLNTRIMGL
jgi:flagellar biosynthesis protein FlhG